MAKTRNWMNGDARREQILEVATALFIERGFANVKAGDIADTIGMSRPNMYSFFNSTEKVFEAALEHYSAGLVASCEKAQREGILMSVSDSFDLLLHHRELTLLLRSAGDPILRDQRRKVYDTFTKYICALLDAHVLPQQRKNFDMLLENQHTLYLDMAYNVLTAPEAYDLPEVKAQLETMLEAAYARVVPQINEAWKNGALGRS